MATDGVQTNRTVLVAVDESEHSKQAFEYGLNIPVEEWQKAIQDQLKKVEKLEADYEADMLMKKIHYKLKGEMNKAPGQGIIQVAEDENADLVVMGTRGLDVVRRTLLGSVSDYVVRHSRVPVLVCPSMPK